MEPEEEQTREPWEIPELKEGFDVFNYDAQRAKRGQRLVLIIFAIAITLLALSWWALARRAREQEQRKPHRIEYTL